MKAKIIIRLKNGVLDPQGKAILSAAHSIGFSEVLDVRVGRVFEVELDAKDAAQARQRLEELSAKLFANTVIENFEVEILSP